MCLLFHSFHSIFVSIYPVHYSKFKRYKLSSFGKFKEKKIVLNAVDEYFYTVLIVAVLKKNAISNYL